MKRIMLCVSTALVVVSLGWAIGTRLFPKSAEFLPPASSADGGQAGIEEIAASWVFPGMTVAEETAEADLIVRVRVLNVNVRKLRQVGPRYAADGTTVLGEDVEVMPFTDARMQVLEVYKGSADNHIVVMQMGGELPATDGDPAINYMMPGDPIFVRGSEHILFLKDISDDPVHNRGINRRLYRLVNPAGRYEIQGDKVTNCFSVEASLPTTLGELLNQIRQAVNQSP